MDEKELSEVTNSAATISWAAMIESSLADPQSGMHFSGASSARLDEVWIGLRKETFDLICTNSAKYAKERAAFSVTLKPAIAALAAFLTKDYGFPVAAASSLSSLALLLPVRMAKNAWCSAIDNDKKSALDRKELRKLIEERAAKAG